MIIVGQDKDVMINFERFNFIKIEPSENEFDIEINYADDEYDVIGTYDSYKRSKEILNEIIYEFKKVVVKVNRQSNMQPEFYNTPKVYYMPEK